MSDSGHISEFSYSRYGRRLASACGINELMIDVGEALAGSGRDVCMLGGGNPAHVPAVEAVWRRRWAELGADPRGLAAVLGDYDGPAGSPRFLESLAAFLNRRLGWGIGPENLCVTNGSQTAFFQLFHLLAGEGARGPVLFPVAPEYIGYPDQSLAPGMFRALPATLELEGDRRFKYRVDFARLEAQGAISALCLSRPTNPSGNMVTDAELARLIAFARSRGVPLLLDHAYDAPFPGVVEEERAMPWDPNVVHVFSLSKLGLPGARTGVVAGEPGIVRRLAASNAVLALANGNVGQAILAPLLDSGELDRLCREEIRTFYRARAGRTQELIDRAFSGGPECRIHRSEGAFFLWLWFPGLRDDRELYARLKARGVILVPGSYFFYALEEPWPHARQCLRLCYCAAPEAVEKGIAVLRDEAAKLCG